MTGEPQNIQEPSRSRQAEEAEGGPGLACLQGTWETENVCVSWSAGQAVGWAADTPEHLPRVCTGQGQPWPASPLSRPTRGIVGVTPSRVGAGPAAKPVSS